MKANQCRPTATARPTPEPHCFASVDSGEADFYLSQVGQLEEDGNQWGFNLYSSDRAFIARFVYADDLSARSGFTRIARVMVVSRTTFSRY
jgi:hypothetical protein